MKRSEAARYARWSATLALLLAVITVGVYVQHGVVARIQKGKAPPAPANNVERQSNGLTFSKVDGDRKIFTVEASKSTEFRNQDASLLEEVKITIFGAHSERHDTITHAQLPVLQSKRVHRVQRHGANRFAKRGRRGVGRSSIR